MYITLALLSLPSICKLFSIILYTISDNSLMKRSFGGEISHPEERDVPDLVRFDIVTVS